MDVAAERRQRLAAAVLYALTPELEPQALMEWVQRACSSGIEMLQLRHKRLTRRQLFEVAAPIGRICRSQGMMLIVNDFVDLAMTIGADGVHLGQEDLPLPVARRLLGPEMVIGVSAGTVESVLAADDEGADYIGAGPLFATPVKADKAPVGPQWVALLSAISKLPVFAIGGIDSENLESVVGAGVRRVCVGRGMGMIDDIVARGRLMRQILDSP